MQRALVGATEGIAWELLWKLASIKEDLGKSQSLTDMVNEALPATLRGVSRKALSIEGMQPSLQASSCMHHLPTGTPHFLQQNQTMCATEHHLAGTDGA